MKNQRQCLRMDKKIYIQESLKSPEGSSSEGKKRVFKVERRRERTGRHRTFVN